MNRKFDLNHMMMFLAVVDAGSFTLAADRLSIPRANLSRKISQLEAQLGVVLLERTTRSQHITEVGKAYLEHCRRIQEEIDLAEALITKTLNKVAGQLKIGASVGMGHELLKPVLGKFMHQYPEINLQLKLLNQRVDLIEEGFDLVIRIGELEDSRLVAKHLGQVDRKIYVSPDYLKRHKELRTIEQISEYDFLLMSSIQDSGRVTLNSGKLEHSLQVAPKMLVDDFLILKQMVIDGVGIATIPNYMCHSELKNGTLTPLFKDWGLPSVDVYALYPKHRSNIPKVSAFLSYIKEVFEERL